MRPALPALLLSAALLSACTGEPAPERLAAPPVEEFREGTCALVAEDLIAVGRTVRDLEGPDASREVRTELEDAQKALQVVAETAEPEVKELLDTVVTRTGIVRIALDAERYEPSLSDALAESYAELVATCTDDGEASPG